MLFCRYLFCLRFVPGIESDETRKANAIKATHSATVCKANQAVKDSDFNEYAVEMSR